MKFISDVVKLDSRVWYMHLTVPKEVSDHFKATTGTRVICNIDDRWEFHAALMSKKGGTCFINVNKDIRNRLDLNEGDKIPVSLEPDTSRYGIHLPPEMEELLDQDTEGSAVFHKLTPGKQRTLLHLVGTPKSSDTRLRKALMTLDYLKSVNGELDYKELNLFYKEQREDYA